MGARLVRLVDGVAFASRLALAASVGALALGAASDFGWSVPLEVAIAGRLADVAGPTTLERRIAEALDREDVALARGFADLAADLKRPLRPETLARLAAAEAPGATAWRNVRGAARGFVTGASDGPAALTGAIAADLTVVGDVRDLVGEGGKALRGEDHSELLLGLAAVGIAATAATVATAGGAAPLKFGVSVLKAARRAGTLTADFAAHLGRTLFRTADVRAVRATGAAPLRAARSIDARALGAVASELRAVGSAVGPAETVRLLRFVRSGEDLSDLGRFTRRFGTRSRAVAELAGRASLRAFKTTIRLAEMLLKHLGALIAWFGGLLAGALANAGRRGARLAAARI